MKHQQIPHLSAEMPTSNNRLQSVYSIYCPACNISKSAVQSSTVARWQLVQVDFLHHFLNPSWHNFCFLLRICFFSSFYTFQVTQFRFLTSVLSNFSYYFCLIPTSSAFILIMLQGHFLCMISNANYLIPHQFSTSSHYTWSPFNITCDVQTSLFWII